MTPRTRDRIAIGAWLVVVALSTAIVANARFTADLSAFLPTRPTPEQALLIDQLRAGPASHLILVAIAADPGTTVSDTALAKLSRDTAARLRTDRRFLSISNGESVTSSRDRELLFNHRYLLSDRVVPARFTVDGLRAALDESLDLLSSSAGPMLQPLLARDPTAELLHLVDTLTAGRDLPMVGGAWVTRSAEEGPHALLVAETAADGSDIDGQKAAMQSLRDAFDAARRDTGDSARGARLVLSGPPVFAVDARDTIERDATRLSIAGAVLVALLLGFVYRSPRALLLGLLPMATGALCGLAAVAVGFGVVHGIALGFGVTLIGEAVDYAIYLFVQGAHRPAAGARSDGFWSTIALGVATSAIGFAALTFSGFQGLAQIGVLSIVGLVVAALVTRWVVPAWLPTGFRAPPLPRVGRSLDAAVDGAGRLRWPLVALSLAAVASLAVHRDALWSRDLSSLSPVSASLQETDARLRSELGAPDVRDVVVIRAADAEGALQASERVVAALAPLVTDGALAGVEAPSRYLPSRAVQEARRAALPTDDALRTAFAEALAATPFLKTGFDGFFADVARERSGGVVTRADLDGTSMAPALRALLDERAGGDAGPLRWTAVVALRSPPEGNAPAPAAQGARARVVAAVSSLQHGTDARLATIRAIDIKTETQDLYAGYLSEALHMAGLGATAIVLLLAVVLRSAARLARVVAPLAVAVLLVAAAHVVLGGPLTLFHFVGLLLIVAVGSNYTLFFDRRSRAGPDVRPSDDDALLVSLAVANLTAVIGFGVLGWSSLPVLHAIGTTVAPGALLALLCAAVFAAPTYGAAAS